MAEEIDQFIAENCRSLPDIQIATKVNLSRSGVTWRRLKHLKIRKILAEFVNQSSDIDLAYVIAVTLGDGCIKNRGVVLTSINQAFIDEFNQHISRVLGKGKLYATFKRKDGKYEVDAYSKAFSRYLKQLSFEKLKGFLDSLEKKVAFLKGFYESEGNLDHPNGRNSYRIRISNSNQKLISLVFCLLKELEFHPTITRTSREKWGEKEEWKVNLNRSEEALKFLTLVQPIIKKECDYIR
jgi:DNA-binding transcriptional regulator WhiA